MAFTGSETKANTFSTGASISILLVADDVFMAPPRPVLIHVPCPCKATGNPEANRPLSDPIDALCGIESSVRNTIVPRLCVRVEGLPGRADRPARSAGWE